MKISSRWQLAWRYRPTMDAMMLGGDFIGAGERPDGSLSLLIGDVTGHGPTAAGIGAMLRAARLSATQAGVALESLPELLHRLLVNQAELDVGTLATVCLAEVDRHARELRMIRAGHDCRLLITREAVSEIGSEHGPALGLSGHNDWPLQRLELPSSAAIMMFTDGLTECRPTPRLPRLGVVELRPRLDPRAMLGRPAGEAIDGMLKEIFPEGTQALNDDLAVILLNLSRNAAAAGPGGGRR